MAIAVPIATVIAGAISAKTASNASKRSAAVQSHSDDAAMAEAQAQRAEQARQWEAQQELERQKYAAAEEERAYTRRLQEEREARAAPYRAASAAALGNLGQMLGLDFGTSALAQNLSSPRMAPAGSPAPAHPDWQTMRNPMAMPDPTQQVGPMGPAPTIGTLTGLRPRRPLTQRS